ncbi:MAG: hypothetical protein GF344_04015 [Chitinivibrionales bacterium]|nr:hypothetical protein [Chitinivibrionales bacterium]MBD3356219.1 hypothetical protein [Chitinivibrionales bacterium]
MEQDNVWEKIKKGLKDGAATSMEKIEEYTKVGKLKIEELAARRKIERNAVDIGERVVELMNEGRGSEIESDLTVRKAVESIGDLKRELEEIDKKIKIVPDEVKAAKEEKSRAEEEPTAI